MGMLSQQKLPRRPRNAAEEDKNEMKPREDEF